MWKAGKRWWKSRGFLELGLIATVSIVAISGDADWRAPPRFDGAGYAVLAQALLEGEGYRAIDHPDRPRHAHFPPGYSSVLALTWWTVGGRSVVAAHLVSAACTVGATVLGWWWYRRLFAGPTAFLLGLALAVNWVWARTGSVIQSEPLYLLLGQATLLAATAVCSGSMGGRSRAGTRGWLGLIGLGVLLGACALTRQVALGMGAGIVVVLVLERGWRAGAMVGAVAGAVVAPWVWWTIALSEQSRNQASLLAVAGESLAGRVARQVVFYAGRIPDQVTGPFVEVGTVFQSSRAIAVVAGAWGAIASGVVVVGWVVAVRSRRRRLAGLVPLFTLGLLTIWPFTEAGRFLIPLIPCIVIGAVEGLARLATLIRWPVIGQPRQARARWMASALVLLVSVPYSAYVFGTGRSRNQAVAQRAFDAACDWIGGREDRPGPVLTRHPGEVFWRSGRQAVEVTSSERPGDRDADDVAIVQMIERYRVAFLLVDRDRYTNAVSSPLGGFAARHPEFVRRVWKREGDREAIEVYEVAPGR